MPGREYSIESPSLVLGLLRISTPIKCTRKKGREGQMEEVQKSKGGRRRVRERQRDREGVRSKRKEKETGEAGEVLMVTGA